jgi:phosphoglycolate phosphatase-like HAD superfamily hydrolase
MNGRTSAEGRRRPGEYGRGHGMKSAAAREKAILALLTERTLDRAARRCGLSERTLRRWQTEDAEFKADLEAVRSALFQAGISRIQTLVGRAIDTLEDLLAATESSSVRLGAARTIAEIGIHQHEADAILRKLGEIEAAQERRRRR